MFTSTNLRETKTHQGYNGKKTKTKHAFLGQTAIEKCNLSTMDNFEGDMARLVVSDISSGDIWKWRPADTGTLRNVQVAQLSIAFFLGCIFLRCIFLCWIFLTLHFSEENQIQIKSNWSFYKNSAEGFWPHTCMTRKTFFPNLTNKIILWNRW